MSDDVRAVSAYTDEVKEEIKRTQAHKVFSLDNIRLYECPLSYLSEYGMRDVVRAVYLVEGTGHLYYAGGVGDQPHWLIEAIEIFRGEKIIADRKRAENGRAGIKSHNIGGG